MVLRNFIFARKVRNSCVREVNNYVVTEFYPKNPLFFFVLKLLPLGIDSELTTVFHLIVPIMSLASHKNLHGHCMCPCPVHVVNDYTATPDHCCQRQRRDI